MTRADARARRAPRWATYIVRRGWSHLLLVTAALIFLFPFAWMVATSLKTDEEIMARTWWPALPSFCDHSPYVRPPVRVERPTGVTDKQWDANLPVLRAAAEHAVDDELARRDNLPDSDRVRLHAAATPVVLNRLIGRLNTALWRSNQSDLLATFERSMTSDVVASSLDDRLARVELLELQIRTLDARIFNLCRGVQIASTWRVGSGDARLIADGPDATRLEYRFPTSQATPIVLRYDFNFPADPAELQRLSLALRADDSWHRLDASLDVAGQTWRSTRSTYLAQHRVMSAMFQPPTFNDETFQPRIWVPLEQAGTLAQTSTSDRHATLRITISPSSTTQAVWGKVARNFGRAFHAVPFWRYV